METKHPFVTNTVVICRECRLYRKIYVPEYTDHPTKCVSACPITPSYRDVRRAAHDDRQQTLEDEYERQQLKASEDDELWRRELVDIKGSQISIADILMSQEIALRTAKANARAQKSK